MKWNFSLEKFHSVRFDFQQESDGKQVRIQKPNNAGSFYYNYKHTHSIILMAVAGPEYECLYADVGSNGGVNYSGIWNRTALLQGIQNGSL